MKKLTVTQQLTSEITALEKENKALQETVTKLLKELDRIKGIKSNIILSEHLSAEEEILELQINRIQAISRERLLDIDETRQLDVLLKNKQLFSQNKTVEDDLKDVTPEMLLLIAESDNGKKEK